jgi:hypothetical protein
MIANIGIKEIPDTLVMEARGIIVTFAPKQAHLLGFFQSINSK